jgi:uncharacterized membrane protein
MSKKEDNQFIRILFVLIYGTVIGALGYLSKDSTKVEWMVFVLVLAIIFGVIFLSILAKKHKDNSNEIED